VEEPPPPHRHHLPGDGGDGGVDVGYANASGGNSTTRPASPKSPRGGGGPLDIISEAETENELYNTDATNGSSWASNSYYSNFTTGDRTTMRLKGGRYHL
jgi:hypothetical protein